MRGRVPGKGDAVVSRSFLVLPILALLPLTACALGLGDLQPRSYLGQPLEARLAISGTPQEIATLKVRLVPEDADRSHPDAPPAPPLRLELVTEGEQAYVHITSDEVIREPVLRLPIQVTWAQGQVIRDYALLLDLPQMKRAVNPASEQVAPVVQANVAPAADRAADCYGPVQPAETLAQIAQRLRPDARFTLAQTMVAIYRANPTAFGHGIDDMMAGAILHVPTAAAIAAIPADQAREFVAAQSVPSDPASPRAPAAPVRRRHGDSRPRSAAPAHLMTAIESPAIERQPAVADGSPSPAARAQAAAVSEPANAPLKSPAEVYDEAGTAAPARRVLAPAAASRSAGLQEISMSRAKTPQRSESMSNNGWEWLWERIVAPRLLAGLGVLGALLVVWQRKRRAPDREAAQAVDRAGASMPADPIEPRPFSSRPQAYVAANVTEDLRVEHADPMAEIGFYFSQGLYTQALNAGLRALQAEPERRDLQLKCLEILFATGKAEDFLERARALAAGPDGKADTCWAQVASMGRQLWPQEALFRPAALDETAADGLAAQADEAGSGASPVTPALSETQDWHDGAAGEHPAVFSFESGQASASPEAPSVAVDAMQDEGGERVSSSWLTTEAEAEEVIPWTPQIPVAEGQDAGFLTPQTNDPAEEGLEFHLTRQSADEPDGFEAALEFPPDLDPAQTFRPLDDELETKLDLAQAYLAMGELQETRDLLQEVLAAGDEAQRHAANVLMQQLSEQAQEYSQESGHLPSQAFDAEEDRASDLKAEDDLQLEDADLDDAETKLDLARAYLDMADAGDAHALLAEVLRDGDAEQRRQAQELLARLEQGRHTATAPQDPNG